MEVRTKLYELLSHCIPPSVILKVFFLIIHDVYPLLIVANTDDCKSCS